MGRKANKEPIRWSQLGPVCLLGLLGGIGLLGGGQGAGGAHALLAWLTLLSIPAGILAARRRTPLWPMGLLVPGFWCFFLIFSALGEERRLPAPMAGMAALAGMYAIGFGLGCFFPKAPGRAAAIALFSLLLLTALPQMNVLARPGAPPARQQPSLARVLLELSPLVFTYECAGVDWTHANPQVYSQSGVEWFHRNAYNGKTAGPAVLLLGVLFAWLADWRRRLDGRDAEDGLAMHPGE